jgi:hypothetical protein
MRARLLRFVGLGVVLAAVLAGPNISQALAGQVCTSTSQCPPGTLCCYPCGVDGCQDMCLQPLHGHCPLFP